MRHVRRRINMDVEGREEEEEKGKEEEEEGEKEKGKEEEEEGEKKKETWTKNLRNEKKVMTQERNMKKRGHKIIKVMKYYRRSKKVK